MSRNRLDCEYRMCLELARKLLWLPILKRHGMLSPDVFCLSVCLSAFPPSGYSCVDTTWEAEELSGHSLPPTLGL